MDGTLLNSQKQIPKHFFEMIKRLKAQGVYFTAASGRSYPKMEQDFAQGLEDMYFICDNGGMVFHRGEVLCQNPIDRTQLMELIDICEQLSDVVLILCGTKGVWYRPCDCAFQKDLDDYYINQHIIEDLHQVPDEIVKASICDLKNPMLHSQPLLRKHFENRYCFAVSGDVWMDIMSSDVNKGAALEMLQQRLQIQKEETMAFGDFYNDIELLQAAKYSYVMENANYDMRQYGNHIAPSNDKGGVMKVIYQQLFSEEWEELD